MTAMDHQAEVGHMLSRFDSLPTEIDQRYLSDLLPVVATSKAS